jgi:hypothetical protein
MPKKPNAKARKQRTGMLVRCLGCQRTFQATGQHHNYCRPSCRVRHETRQPKLRDLFPLTLDSEL